MQKAAKVARKFAAEKAAVEKIEPVIKTMIGAGTASPAPPLGPLLGQKGVNVASFCKDFNARTAHIVPGVPLPTMITVNPDRTYGLEVQTPHIPWLIMRCAGIRCGSDDHAREVIGKITLKHVYEIAKVKLGDPFYWRYDEREMCAIIIDQAKTCGVQVVRSLDAAEYADFLAQRAVDVRQRMLDLEDLKAAKVLRTGTV